MAPLSHAGAPHAPRLHALDTLRTLTVWYVVLYHVADFTLRTHPSGSAAGDAWLLGVFLPATGVWRMPLMFALAGASSALVLRRNSLGWFARERARRLLVPTAFGVAVVLPLLRASQAAGPETLAALLARSWGSSVKPGTLPQWWHLWFVAYLVVITAGAVLTCAAARSLGRRGHWRPVEGAVTAARGYFARHPWAPVHGIGGLFVAVYLLPTRWVVPLSVVPGLDVRVFAASAVAFAAGAVLVACDGRLGSVTRARRGSAVCALLLTLLMGAFLTALQSGVHLLPPVSLLRRSLVLDEWVTRGVSGAGAWFAMLAVLGYSLRYARPLSPAASYLRDASFVIYMLHQTTLAWVARSLAAWHAPTPVLCATLVVLTVVGTLAAYEFGIRRVHVGRVLFGLPERVAHAPFPFATVPDRRPEPVRLPPGAGYVSPQALHPDHARAPKPVLT